MTNKYNPTFTVQIQYSLRDIFWRLIDLPLMGDSFLHRDNRTWEELKTEIDDDITGYGMIEQWEIKANQLEYWRENPELKKRARAIWTKLLTVYNARERTDD